MAPRRLAVRTREMLLFRGHGNLEIRLLPEHA